MLLPHTYYITKETKKTTRAFRNVYYNFSRGREWYEAPITREDLLHFQRPKHIFLYDCHWITRST